jgi:hypothetical protein
MKNIFSKEYDLYQKLNSEANFELLSKELIKMWIIVILFIKRFL